MGLLDVLLKVLGASKSLRWQSCGLCGLFDLFSIFIRFFLGFFCIVFSSEGPLTLSYNGQGPVQSGLVEGQSLFSFGGVLAVVVGRCDNKQRTKKTNKWRATIGS